MGKIKYRTCQHFRPPVRAEPVRKNKNISTGITKIRKEKKSRDRVAAEYSGFFNPVQ